MTENRRSSSSASWNVLGFRVYYIKQRMRITKQLDGRLCLSSGGITGLRRKQNGSMRRRHPLWAWSETVT